MSMVTTAGFGKIITIIGKSLLRDAWWQWWWVGGGGLIEARIMGRRNLIIFVLFKEAINT
jgi:hypothetical protein